MKGVSPSFLAELQSKTINSPQKKKKKQELTLASRVMVLSLLYLLKYWPRPDRTRLRTSWKIINLRMRINRLELPRPLSGPRMCSGHSRCSRCSSYASDVMTLWTRDLPTVFCVHTGKVQRIINLPALKNFINCCYLLLFFAPTVGTRFDNR